jgi:transcriptional regulator with XRE-family HTH domain
MNGSSIRTAAPPYSIRIDPCALRHAMRVRGLTGAELARRAKVSEATISHALNGRRIHPATLRAINTVLRAVPPLDNVEALVTREEAVILGPGA